MKKILFAVVIFLYILFSPRTVFAATIYTVSPNGSDNNDGTTKPWKTIQKATTVMKPGDTVLIRAGTYQERVQLDMGASGTAGNPITYKNYPNETPVLDGSAFTGWGSAFMSGFNASKHNTAVHYIIIDGLEITRYPEAGIVFERNVSNQSGSTGSHNITIQNCTIHDNYLHGIYMEGGDVSVGGESHDLLITHNLVYNNSDHNIKFQGDASGVINRLQIRNSEISYNTSYGSKGGDSHGQGIHCSTGCHDNVITHNTSYSNGTYGISLYEAWNNTVEYNTVNNNGKVVSSAGGIVVWRSSNNTLRYNTVYSNPGTGIEISSTLSGATTGHKIYNNSIIENGTGISISNTSNGGIVTNNIFYQNGTQVINNNSSTFDFNLYYPNVSFTGRGIHDITGNPLFVNPTSGDYHLQSNSPACAGGEGGTYIGAYACVSGSTPVPVPGDLNGDGHVDLFDYNELVTYFGNPYTIYDYNILVANFGK